MHAIDQKRTDMLEFGSTVSLVAVPNVVLDRRVYMSWPQKNNV